MFQYVRSVCFASFLVLFSITTHAGELININTASATVIAENLSGIGHAKAIAIIEYRTANGKFTSVDDLVKVKGIGAKLLDRNRALIALTDRAPAAPPAAAVEGAKQVQPNS